MIDYEFIGELEGNSLVGYVPEPDGGAIESGVTIASGFDLGQRHGYELIGLPDHLVDLLSPYCNMTGYDAINFLQLNPLEITQEEADRINEFAHSESEHYLVQDWEDWSMINWDDLTDRQQTVVASVAFQYGDLPTRTPNFWRQVTSGQWDDAVTNLRDFGDNYPTRRNKEADYLCNII